VRVKRIPLFTVLFHRASVGFDTVPCPHVHSRSPVGELHCVLRLST